MSRSPNIFIRLRILFSLLAGLSREDFRSAGTFIRLRFPEDPFPLRIWKFLAWCLKVMWREIPDSHSWVTLDKKPSRTPYWLTAPNPLQNHPWRTAPETSLPESATVVVVGAGFGGAAVAYHWSKQASQSLLVLERDEAASGAAGRNAGFLVTAGGHLHGYYVYHRVIRYLAQRRPQMSSRERTELAVKFADVYVKALEASYEMIKATIQSEGIECDYAQKGWLFFAEPFDRKELEAALALARRCGWSDFVRRTSAQVRERSGVNTSLEGAESLGSATWHPAKWVWGILGVALRNPNVQLFTHTTVQRVERDGDFYRVHTDRGTIRSRHVVNATESHTPAVFKNFLAPFPDLIIPHRSQAIHSEGGPDSMKPQVAVSGPLGFYSRIAQGGMVFGSDSTPVAPEQAGLNQPSRFITRFQCTEIGKYWGLAPLRVTHEWTGTTSTTPDKYPVIGLMDGHGLFILGGFAGAGSAASFNAGQTIVFQILRKASQSNYHPEEYFSPMRFIDFARYGRRP